jgi:hypothetical protein
MNIIYTYIYNKYSQPGKNRTVGYYGNLLLKTSAHTILLR